MKKLTVISFSILFLLFLSCKGQIEPVQEEINTDLLTTKARHKVKAVLINNSGMESDMSTNWEECTFQSTYKFNDDSTYVQNEVCFDDSLISHWEFRENKTKIYVTDEYSSQQYLILKLTEDELQLEWLNDDNKYQTVYTYK